MPAYAVTGGTEVDDTSFHDDWSFTVGLGIAADGFVSCTGSLVSPTTVVTAAHCIPPDAPPDTVYFGSPDLATASQVAITSAQRNFFYDAGNIAKDDAVVRLAHPVTGVTPIRVVTPAEVAALGSPVSVRFAGFGWTADATGTTVMHAGTGTVTSSAKWQLSPGSTVTTCQGDSGGPLVATLPSGDDVLIGATSSGTQTCPGPSTWTDLGRDLYIQNVMEQLEEPPPEDPPPVQAILQASVSPTTGAAPLTVSFDLTGSHISDGRDATYVVDPTELGDGGGLSANAIESTTPVVTSFTYTQPGTYTALVAVYDPSSFSTDSPIIDLEEVTITVTEPPQTFTVSAFSAPVDSGDTVNVAEAGRTIPLKFRVTDRDGNPVSDLTATDVAVGADLGPCQAGATNLDAIEFYATTAGLTNRGDGYYQYDFKTSKAWAGKCGTVTITTPHSGARSAKMQFKK